MSQLRTEIKAVAAESTDPVRSQTVRQSGCRKFAMIFGFGCLPGLMIGVVAGVVLGAFAWDYAVQEGAMNPLDGLDVPVGRLDFPTIRTTVDELARDYLNNSENVGLAIGVVRGDEADVWCYGRRASNDSELPDGETLFELASVGKTLTGLLLADMHFSGQVDLNDSVQQHLPEGVVVPALNGRAITLLDLATQTSGLPSLPPNFEFGDPLNPYKDYSTAKMFSDLAEIQLTRSPGSEYEYSNLGFGLLGEALAQRGQMDYEQLVIHRICAPLGMNRTRMTLTEELRANFATPHDGRKAVPVWEDVTMPGAGSFLSTANDMLLYLKLFQNPPPDTSTQLVRAALETTIRRRAADSSARSMGLAWHIDSENAHDILWHNGGAGGSCSYIAFTTTPPCGIVILSNSTNSVDELGYKVLYLLLQTAP